MPKISPSYKVKARGKAAEPETLWLLLFAGSGRPALALPSQRAHESQLDSESPLVARMSGTANPRADRRKAGAKRTVHGWYEESKTQFGREDKPRVDARGGKNGG